jgi:acylphosphatase
MSTDHAQLRAVVRGHVQGVSFRYYTQQEALRLGLTGWVRNLPDGTVQVAAEGPRPSLDKFLAFLHFGPSAARVAAVEPAWAPAGGEFSRFEIR